MNLKKIIVIEKQAEAKNLYHSCTLKIKSKPIMAYGRQTSTPKNKFIANQILLNYLKKLQKTESCQWTRKKTSNIVEISYIKILRNWDKHSNLTINLKCLSTRA